MGRVSSALMIAPSRRSAEGSGEGEGRGCLELTTRRSRWFIQKSWFAEARTTTLGRVERDSDVESVVRKVCMSERRACVRRLVGGEEIITRRA